MPVLPLRDVVVYPHMVIPLFVGREKSIVALDLAMKADKRILLVAQKQADVDDPKADDLYRVGTVATILQLLKLPDGTVKVLVEGVDRASIEKLVEGEFFSAEVTALPDVERYEEREMDVLTRSVITQFEQYVKLNKKVRPACSMPANEVRISGGTFPVRTICQTEQEGAARDPHLVGGHRTGRPLGGYGRRPHVLEALRETERSGNPRCAQAARAHARRHRRRNGRAADRKAHSRARQAADGKEPARVLPERADEGHSEGTRRARRCAERNRRTGKAHQGRGHAERGARESEFRAVQTQAHVAHVGRGHRGAQLHRLAGEVAVEEAQQGAPRDHGGGKGARSGSLWPREGQGAHRRIPGRAAEGEEPARSDTVPGRSSRCRQDLARSKRGARHQPQVRAHVLGRRARRGRDPRPSPHLYRLHARQDHSESRQVRGTQSALPAR